MQISNQAVIGGNLASYEKNRKKHVRFGQEPINQNQPQQPKRETEEKHGTGYYVKTATNVLGVLAWLGFVGFSIHNLELFKSGSHQAIERKSKALLTSAKNMRETKFEKGSESVDKLLEGSSNKSIRKAFYNIGNGIQKFKMKTGSELFSNLVYALGTLVVMPAVVLFSPFGKKDSTKEDKMFAVLRQPLSVAATLSMQYTFDKLIGKYVPEVIKQNHMEDASILEKDDKGNLKLKIHDKDNNIDHDVFNKIKYNFDESKKAFKEMLKTGSLKDILTSKQADDLFDMKSYEEENSDTLKIKLKDMLKNKFKDLDLDDLEHDFNPDATKNKKLGDFKLAHPNESKNIEKLLADFEKVTTVLDFKQASVQKSKAWVNVLAASAIGCTFLNVIYGKTMKAMKNHNTEKIANNNENAKEVK